MVEVLYSMDNSLEYFSVNKLVLSSTLLMFLTDSYKIKVKDLQTNGIKPLTFL